MNKLKIFSLLMAVITLASCSSNDDPTNLAPETAGVYSGYTVASCSYFTNMVSSRQDVTITTTELNRINVSYQSDTWGTITISNAELSGTEGNIYISGTGKSVMGHAGDAAKEYDCQMEGTLVGKKLELTFSCPAIMGGLTIEFKQGDIPAEIVVPGTYDGYTEAKSTYFSGMMTDDQKIVITKNSDDTYSIGYTSDTWGEFSIEKATVAYSDGIFTIEGDGITKMGMSGNIKEYACSVEGQIDAEKEDPVFTFSVPAVMGGLSIVFHTGDMPAAE